MTGAGGSQNQALRSRRELARDPYDTMVRTVAVDVRRLRKAADTSDENFRSLVDEMRARYTVAIERLLRRAATSLP